MNEERNDALLPDQFLSTLLKLRKNDPHIVPVLSRNVGDLYGEC